MADATGELMRMVVSGWTEGSSSSPSDQPSTAELERRASKNSEMARLVGRIARDMDFLDGCPKSTRRKISMVKENLSKIESTSYTLRVRSAEDVPGARARERDESPERPRERERDGEEGEGGYAGYNQQLELW